MKLVNRRLIIILTVLFVCFQNPLFAQRTRQRITGEACGGASALNGVYRIDLEGSDKLYSVIESASSNVPFAEQQQFFIDLAVRLTPPDLLAIECRGARISLGSSRAPRVEFMADGVARSTRNANGRTVRSRIAFERDSLVFSSTGTSQDNLSFAFTPLENGRRLRVTRRISARELIEPVVIQTVYDKIDEVARWDIFDNPQVASARQQPPPSPPSSSQPPPSSTAALPRSRTVPGDNNEASALRNSLEEWVDATNNRDIDKQMSFYMPQLKAFYLSRNAPRSAVRTEKIRAFANARSIDIRAAEPEIIFQDGGRTAVMRFRKKYSISNRSGSRSGEVVQELRWQKSGGDWKIFSERDIRVLR